MASHFMPSTSERRSPHKRQLPRCRPFVNITTVRNLINSAGSQTSTGLESVCCFLGALTLAATLIEIKPPEMPGPLRPS